MLRDNRAGALAPLVVGAIGVVFGDIGTSPLYTLRAVLTHDGGDFAPSAVLGVISMIIWCLFIIVTFTYVGLILKANNQGEGGILALAALITRKTKKVGRMAFVVTTIAIIGASLFLGDAMITPAISVLSAAEGLSVINPDLAHLVVPISLVVLTSLFVVQKKGTAGIGSAFGPVMVTWFLVLAALGLPWILREPGILAALSPTYAVAFAVERPAIAFFALGACVLAITGAEALYADLGHFGRRPIAVAWIALALPALLLNYLGQGALLLINPAAVSSPLYELAPKWALVPVVLLATLATVIASQAVITGAFSIVRQAIHMNLLPRMRIVQTSRSSGGQVYLPAVNGILFVGVFALVAAFGSSERLASAYGLAVTGTLLLELSLFLIFARTVWKWSLARVITMAVLVGGLELTIFLANTSKILSGGWIPLAVSALVALFTFTWARGAKIMFGRRHEMEGPLRPYIANLHRKKIERVPGVAVYPHASLTTVPLALRSSVAFSHVLHEHVIIMVVKRLGVPTVAECDRVVVDDLGCADDGIVRVEYRVGFNDSQNLPRALELALHKSPELEFDAEQATYVLSVFRIEPADKGDRQQWPRWQRQLFRRMEKTSHNRTRAFHLPPDRTIVIGAEVKA